MLALLGIPGLVTFEGFAPLVATVSLVQYVAGGGPARSLAVWLRRSVPEQCWLDTSLGVLPQFVVIEFEIVDPWFPVLQWHVAQLLRILDIALVPLRLPLGISNLSFHC